MENYQKLYTTLFNAATDALAQMEQQNFGLARDILIRAQQQTEELYISAEKQDEAETVLPETVNI